jgi:ribosome-binding protein aMBF1 (putative translation factor)
MAKKNLKETSTADLREVDLFLDELRAGIGDRKYDELTERLKQARKKRRKFFLGLAAKRENSGMSQIEVAREMGLSEVIIIKLEGGLLDPKYSLLERYAVVIGFNLNSKLSKGKKKT